MFIIGIFDLFSLSNLTTFQILLILRPNLPGMRVLVVVLILNVLLGHNFDFLGAYLVVNTN